MSNRNPPPEFSQQQIDYLKRTFPLTNPDWRDPIEIIQRRAGSQDVIAHLEKLLADQLKGK